MSSNANSPIVWHTVSMFFEIPDHPLKIGDDIVCTVKMVETKLSKKHELFSVTAKNFAKT